MSYDDRKKIINNIEEKRSGRKLISFCNFDRFSVPLLPGLLTQVDVELKECMFRVLKESNCKGKGVDIFLYTRGGDTNAVWPLVSLLREFDVDFEVLIPFRAHSAGTLFSLAAKKIFMTRIAELSPIDPTTGNQFNPSNPLIPGNQLGISVEDVNAYKDFIKETLDILKEKGSVKIEEKEIYSRFISTLISSGNPLPIHPLAIGNVHRVHKLILRIAKNLLRFRNEKMTDEDIKKIVEKLTVEPSSHLHMFSREDALAILGSDKIQFTDDDLETLLDQLLRQYEDDFKLRSPLFLSRLMGDTPSRDDIRFIGGVVESKDRGYVFETKGKISQFSKLPPNVNVQIPVGQSMPLIPGFPREYNFDIIEQRWHHNTQPEGVTV